MAEEASPPVPQGLELVRILSNDPEGKAAVVLCTAPRPGEPAADAIVMLAKKPWSDADVQSIVEGKGTQLSEFHRNDKFSKYHAQPPAPMNEVAITFICPANEIDITKYTRQRRHVVRETPEIYATATAPFVSELPASQLAWVQAIMDRQAEMDRLLYEDSGAMMVPDTKWDLKDPETLYTLAIFKDRDIKSVRDLRGCHIEMLKTLRAGALAELKERYGVSPSSLRVYMHYLPSFWWGHVHFASLTCPAMSVTTSVGKAILLDDIIDNLQRDPEHYQNTSLTMVVGEGEPLFTHLCKAGAMDIENKYGKN
eukprot:scaffold233065_cov36-Tisochrysis_lutea.AAC.3